MEKPSEFFVGVMDLFGILLPGAVATAMLEQNCHWQVTSLLKQASPDVVHWGVFLVVAYFLGHLIFLVSSTLDIPYRWVGDWRRRTRKTTDKEDPYPVASALRDTLLLTPQERDAVNAFQWARSTLLIQCPAAAQDVHRLEADSKFFRSLFVISVASPCLLNDFTHLGVAAVLAVVCLFCYWRRRSKSIKQACIHIITLQRAVGQGKEAKGAPAG